MMTLITDDWKRDFKKKWIRRPTHWNWFSQTSLRHTIVTSPKQFGSEAMWLAERFDFQDTSPKHWKINSLWLVNFKHDGQWSARIITFDTSRPIFVTLVIVYAVLMQQQWLNYIEYVKAGPCVIDLHIRAFVVTMLHPILAYLANLRHARHATVTSPTNKGYKQCDWTINVTS